MTKEQILYNFLIDFIKTDFREVIYIYPSRLTSWVNHADGYIQLEETTNGSVWSSVSFDVEILKYFPNLYHMKYETILKQCIDDINLE